MQTLTFPHKLLFRNCSLGASCHGHYKKVLSSVCLPFVLRVAFAFTPRLPSHCAYHCTACCVYIRATFAFALRLSLYCACICVCIRAIFAFALRLHSRNICFCVALVFIHKRIIQKRVRQFRQIETTNTFAVVLLDCMQAFFMRPRRAARVLVICSRASLTLQQAGWSMLFILDTQRHALHLAQILTARRVQQMPHAFT